MTEPDFYNALERAFEAGYRNGYSNGLHDEAYDEEQDASPGEGFEMWMGGDFLDDDDYPTPPDPPVFSQLSLWPRLRQWWSS